MVKKNGHKFFMQVLGVGMLSLVFWLIGQGSALAVYPAPWPSSWTAATSIGTAIQDLGDPSGDATYGVSATPSSVDYFNGTSQNLPSVYYAYDATNQVIFVRCRMRGDPYKSDGVQGPYDAYAWHIVFDLNGDGFKDFVIVLDGMAGATKTPYDDIEIYYSPLARRQDFNSSPCASGGDQVWIHDASDGSACCDFKYTRRVDDTASGGGYLLDIQVPLSAFKDCSGNQIIYETTPFMLVYTTSTQNNNPTQKDLVSAGTYTMSATGFLPSGDLMTLGGGISQSPALTDIRSSCAGSTMTLTAYTMDALQVSSGTIVDTINNVTFYYWNGSWIQIGSPVTTPNTGTVNEWAVNWNTTGLSGPYPLRIVITDDQSNVTTDEHWSANVSTCGLNPLLVMFKSFNAWRSGESVEVEWETASEAGTVGFHLYREDPATGEYHQVNEKLLPGLLHSPQGGVYRFIDDHEDPGDTVTYKLEEIDSRGEVRIYGPITVDLRNQERRVSRREAESLPIEEKQDRYTRKPHQSSISKQAVKKQKTQILNSARLAGDRLKITVKETGIYYVDSNDIASSLGIPDEQVRTLIRQNGFKLSNQGNQIPYLPVGGGDGLYFYGTAIQSIYTEENVYWLRKGTGQEMIILHGPRPEPAATLLTFEEIIHAEEDRYPATALVADPQADYWYWDYIVGGDALQGKKTFPFRVESVAVTYGIATLIVDLQGITESGSEGPDHHVLISLNGTFIGEGRWHGQKSQRLLLSFPQDILTEGDNTLEVQGLLDPNIPSSYFYLNSFDVVYQRYYQALNDVLLVRGDKNPVVTIEGFTDEDIYVFDVTKEFNPKLVMATARDQANGRYRVSFFPRSASARYIAWTPRGVKAPSSIMAATSSGLRQKNTGAEYLVITTEGLKEAAARLARYREERGYTTMVVTLEEIYDAFHHGIADPEAIRKLLRFAYFNWTKRPRFVLLAGNGNIDYKNHQGYGDNLLPPLMVNTPYGLFASDNRLADVVGEDGVPEMAIGRLPVLSNEELDEVINKMIAYESAGSDDWKSRVLLLADNPDDGGDFPADSDKIAGLIPAPFLVEEIYLSDYSIEEARQLLMNAITNGAAWINYIGHGGFDRLAREGLLVSDDIPLLANGEKPPIVTAMTCLVSRFDVPGFRTIGERLLLQSGGGAVAVWGPTGLALEEDLMILDEAFYTAVFDEERKTLGEAVLKAVRVLHRDRREAYVGLIYNLLGDPSLQLRY